MFEIDDIDAHVSNMIDNLHTIYAGLNAGHVHPTRLLSLRQDAVALWLVAVQVHIAQYATDDTPYVWVDTHRSIYRSAVCPKLQLGFVDPDASDGYDPVAVLPNDFGNVLAGILVDTRKQEGNHG